MLLNRNVCIKYIYNGKYNSIKAIFKQYYLEKIPVFISEDVNDIVALQLSDKSVVVIINKDLSNRYTDSFVEQIIVFNILNIFYKDCESYNIVDAILAYWYGFSTSIKIINSIDKISKEQKTERIQFIEKLMVSKENLNIPSKDDIINNIKFVKIKKFGDNYEEIS